MTVRRVEDAARREWLSLGTRGVAKMGVVGDAAPQRELGDHAVFTPGRWVSENFVR